MCLITAQKEAMIAQEDITVYKLFNTDKNEKGEKIYYSPFWFTYYQLNELYTTTIKDVPEEDFHDKCAFDSPDQKKLDETFRDQYDRPNWNPIWYTGEERADIRYIGEGFHSINTKERAISTINDSYIHRVILECTIPAGSEYYLNPSGLIVSNQIIVLREVEMDKEKVEKLYNVWVGGGEVNNHPIPKEKAEQLANDYRDEGYDDVIVQEAAN